MRARRNSRTGASGARAAGGERAKVGLESTGSQRRNNRAPVELSLQHIRVPFARAPLERLGAVVVVVVVVVGQASEIKHRAGRSATCVRAHALGRRERACK